MTKLSRTLALTGMLAVAAGTLSVAPAQDAKAKKTAKKGGIIKVHQSPKNEKYYFSLYDADDKYLISSPARGYETKEDVAKGIEAIKAALDGAKTEYVKKADDKDDDKDEKKDKKEPKKEKKGEKG